MELNVPSKMILIPAEELESLKRGQQQIIDQLDQFKQSWLNRNNPSQQYITSKEFMEAVRIRRWKFDQLISTNMLKTIKKKRKIYVLASEVGRYFTDPSIQ
jgi:hypothetical protein